MGVDEHPALVDHMALRSRAVEQLDPHALLLENRNGEPQVAVARIDDQQERVAMEQSATLVGLVGRLAGDQHAERVILGVFPVVGGHLLAVGAHPHHVLPRLRRRFITVEEVAPAQHRDSPREGQRLDG